MRLTLRPANCPQIPSARACARNSIDDVGGTYFTKPSMLANMSHLHHLPLR
jgi:hypothetical protein